MDISTELKDIEEKQEELLRRRKEVLKNLSKVDEEASREGLRFTKNRRTNKPPLDGSDPSNVNEADFQQRKKIRYNNEDRRDNSSHVKKLSSAISLPVDQKAASAAGQKKDEAEFKIEKPEARALPGAVKKRDSNLFKNLMGHLNKAKITLDKQKDLLHQQDQAVHEAAHKDQEEAAKLKEEHMKVLKEKRKQLMEDKIILEKSIIERDKTRLLKKTELHFVELQSFILTKEKPQIFWKPAKTKEVVDKLLDETKTTIQEKKEKAIQLLEEVMKAHLEELNNAAEEETNIVVDEKNNGDNNENKKDESNTRNEREKDDDHNSDDSDESDIEKQMGNE